MIKTPKNVASQLTNKSCTGCGFCAIICPSHAIRILYNLDGFLEPFIDNQKCTGCQSCIKVCYKYSVDFTNLRISDNTDVYAAIANDFNLLDSSSSGGVASLISEYALENDFAVSGVVYDPRRDLCFHSIANTKRDLIGFRESKYLQSETLPAFSNFVPKSKYCVFGTPCQIYGLDRYLVLNGFRKNFILVDLFCKGILSRLLWNNYIIYVKRKYNISDITSIKFRSKKESWHSFQIEIYEGLDCKYSGSVYSDYYYQFMIKNICLGLPCYSCEFRHHLSNADIRLGDFWGSKYYSHEEGVSLVLIRTSTGQDVWQNIKGKCWNENNEPEMIYESQRFDKLPEYPNRRAVLDDLKQGMPIDSIYRKYDMDKINFKMAESKDRI